MRIFSGRIATVASLPRIARGGPPLIRLEVPTKPATNAVAGCS